MLALPLPRLLLLLSLLLPIVCLQPAVELKLDEEGQLSLYLPACPRPIAQSRTDKTCSRRVCDPRGRTVGDADVDGNTTVQHLAILGQGLLHPKPSFLSVPLLAFHFGFSPLSSLQSGMRKRDVPFAKHPSANALWPSMCRIESYFSVAVPAVISFQDSQSLLSSLLSLLSSLFTLLSSLFSFPLTSSSCLQTMISVEAVGDWVSFSRAVPCVRYAMSGSDMGCAAARRLLCTERPQTTCMG
eukprot:575076-Rhodomonas_salina.1